MTKDEALKLALEALEGLFGIPDYWTSEGGGGVSVWRMGGSDAPRQAITAIKEALAQPQRPWVGLTDVDTHAIWDKDFRGWISRDSMEQIAQAIEAKLKEKNT